MRRPCPTAAALLLLALAGCDRPQPLLICHNSNCAGPLDLSRDATLDALHESLALRFHGRPAIDGTEIDILWDSADARCVFEHEPGEREAPPDAEQATRAIIAHLEQPGDVSWNRAVFYVKIELKRPIARSGAGADPDLAPYADCALAQLALLDEAAARTGRSVEVIFHSSIAELLDALRARPGWPTATASEHARVVLSAGFTTPQPFGEASPLRDFSDVDIIDFQLMWITDAAYNAYLSLGVRLNLGMYSATTETFNAIERFDPDFVGTGEALLLRSWLEGGR